MTKTHLAASLLSATVAATFTSKTVLQGQLFSYFLSDPDGTWLDYNVTQASGDVFQFGGEDSE